MRGWEYTGRSRENAMCGVWGVERWGGRDPAVKLTVRA